MPEQHADLLTLSSRSRSRRQLVEQVLSLLQIERIEPLGKPAVDRSEKIAGLIPLALIAPEPRHAHRGAQFPGLSFLLTRDRGPGEDEASVELAKLERR